MPDRSPASSAAVVICTRNRPDELAKTLRSVAGQKGAARRRVLVVDASDPDNKHRTAQAIATVEDDVPIQHCLYQDPPSLARQRNHGVERLPSAVDIVHFIDDDVTLRPGYFFFLSTVIHTHPEVSGVGGLILEPDRSPSSRRASFLRRVFLLDHSQDGHVLPSGATTSAQLPTPVPSAPDLRSTEWLSGCSSTYRRALLDRHRFDDTLTGYSMLEDLDLSYRIGQGSRLVVQPEAQLLHRRSPRNRFDAEQYHAALTVHRRWFIEKHFGNLRSRAAYWWSTMGRALALLTSSASHARSALRGLLQGARLVWNRQSPLLRRAASDDG